MSGSITYLATKDGFKAEARERGESWQQQSNYKTMTKLAGGLHLTVAYDCSGEAGLTQASPVGLFTRVCKHKTGRRTAKRKAKIYLSANRLTTPGARRSIEVIEIGYTS
jgi:hypothetical protein